ncbi:hypothetical protein [Desulfovibrio desulfuricans]|uniref:hypothetical protein n=1 Tax=Desulfovibrio desulfuricans TaxID=876 RepID=UPI0003B556D3|nr:hypothetical protein [Desulfovibrio desulfuricans]MDD3684213.1 translation initiation factor 2 [Desulfovibrio desulfuricans]QTO40796.1 translation initiation factor 2 [Desulfovibrio desulfuricans]
MRKILALILTLGLTTGGCAWFGGSSSTDEEIKPAQPQEQTAAPEPAPAPVAPAKDAKGKKGKTKAEKAAEVKPVATKKGAKTEAQAAAELTMVGHKLAAQAARTVMPSKSSREVRQDGKDYVGTYIDVDSSNVTTELRPSPTGQYVGFIRYQERVMDCRGKTRQEAMSTASCEQVKARNINELIRFDGSTWQY